MISLNKLRQLPGSTRLRKVIRLFDGFVQYRTVPDTVYLRGLIQIAADFLPEATEIVKVPAGETDAIVRQFDTLRYRLRKLADLPVGDWDLFPPAGYGAITPVDAAPELPPFRLSVYLEAVRSPFNVGSIIRTAAALGIERVIVSRECPDLEHPRVVRSACGALDLVTVERSNLGELGPESRPFVALELGGEPIDDFMFPPGGTLAVGSEELGLSREALSASDYRVSIPLSGGKASLNVGVACGIALRAWCVQTRMSDSDA